MRVIITIINIYVTVKHLKYFTDIIKLIATAFSYKRVFHAIHNTQTTQSMHIPVRGLLYMYGMQIIGCVMITSLLEIYWKYEI